MKFLTAIIASVLTSCAQVELPATSRTINAEIVTAVRSMPRGKGYDTSPAAVTRLSSAVTYRDQSFPQNLDRAGSTFCSGATYLIFLRTIERLGFTKSLPDSTLKRLGILDVKDGEEVFGRWNANGPGTAKLFADLDCGVNFTSYENAEPGDFLKMWWTDAIGARERGHLVVFLSQTPTTLTYWSANQPGGYGKKTVAKSKIKHLIFSRFSKPQNLRQIANLPAKDPFLANMLRQDFTWDQVVKACKVRETP